MIKKTRIKEYVNIVKKMNKVKQDGRVFMVARDIVENKVYFCNGHVVLSVPVSVYDQMIETGEKVLEVNQRDSAMIANAIESAKKEDMTNARIIPFMHNIYNGVANILKSVNSANETAFTLVNNIYCEMLETVSNGCGELLVARRAPEKSPVLTSDIYGVSFLALPIHNNDLTETVKMAFDL